MQKINYVIGDATEPTGQRPVIAHICNNKNKWGAGFTGALSDKYPQAEQTYRRYMGARIQNNLGEIQVSFGPSVIVVNMIAQDGLSKPDLPAIRYDALAECLKGLAKVMQDIGPVTSGVHMPRIGTGWAGGKWEEIEPLIVEHLCAKDIPVTVYDLPNKGG